MKKQKFLRIAAFAIAALATLVVLAASIISLTGRREWERVRAELISRGEPVEIPGIVPKPIPPNENFFADPIWDGVFGRKPPEGPLARLIAPLNQAEQERLRARFPALASKIDQDNGMRIARDLFNDTKDRPLTPDEAALILELTAPAGPVLTQIGELGQRPDAVAPLNYMDGFAMQLPHATVVMDVARILAQRAAAQAALGDSKGALEDTLLIFRLGHVFHHEQLLISLLCSLSVNDMALDLVQRLSDLWNAQQITQVETALGQLHPLRQAVQALAGERAMGLQFFNRLTQLKGTLKELSPDLMNASPVWFGPFLEIHRRVFLDYDTATYAHQIDEFSSLLQHSSGVVSPAAMRTIADGRPMNIAGWPLLFSKLSIPVFPGTIERTAWAENRVRQARTACAIRRFFLARQTMPTSLQALVPDFLGEVPQDVITGRPMNYRPTGGTDYLLWSVGWNETDESGATPKPRNDRKSNDWVWTGRASAPAAGQLENPTLAPQ